jgi:hypothetical protein
MANGLKVWTTAGSAGTLSHTDLAKVNLYRSIIQLGMDVPTSGAIANTRRRAASSRVELAQPLERAVVRYNVVAVDGPNPFSRPLQHRYHLIIRYRGQVSAKLMKVDITRGTEVEILNFDSNNFPGAPDFRYEAVSSDAPLKYNSEGWDRVEMAYYVEATLATPSFALGHPAAIAAMTLLVASDTSSERSAGKGLTTAFAMISQKESKRS